MQIVEVIEVGPGWNRVRLGDGQIYTLEGNYNWRSNNPGNIEYGPFAISMGAIGEGAVPKGRQRGFAIFPTLEDGQRAREVLQFESDGYLNADTNERWGHNYPDGSIGAAIYRYAPPTENDTEGYIRAVAAAAGVSPNTMMRDLTPQQRAAFMEEQQRHEGWKVGDIYTADGVKLPPGEIPNVVASETDVRRPQSVPPTMPTPREQRPGAQVALPTPADQRPPDQTPVPANVAAPQGGTRLLPTIGPTGIEKADGVGTMPGFAEVSGLGRRGPALRPEEVAASRQNGMTPELDADGNVRYRHIPPEDLVRTSVTGGLGSLTPNPVQETAPDPIPPAAYRKPTPPVPTNGGFAGQERAPAVAPKQAAQRVGTPQAGQVALPAAVKPVAATQLMEQAQTAQRRSQIEQQPASFAGQERTTAIKAPRPVSRAAISYAGQERAPPRAAAPEAPRPDPMPSAARTELTFAQPTFAGQEGAPPAAAPSNGNNLGSRTRPEPTAAPGAPPNIGARPRTETPAPTAGTAPGAATAASPADVPKYITRTERIEIPQRFAGEDAAKPKGGVPLGERTYSGSRDSKAQVEAGENAAATMGEQLRNTQQGPLYRTRTVVELNPKWVEAQKPIGGTPTAKPQEQRPFIETVRTGLGLPAEGFGPGILRGIQDGFANAFGLGGGGRPGAATRTQRVGVPLSSAQIQAARANPQNHNALAMAAIERGQRSYTTSGGAVMPTTAMNGKVRNTYGDSGGGSLSG